MRNRLLIFTILLFFASMTLGKGVSDYIPQPEISYIVSGNVLASSGVSKSGVTVMLDVTNTDTTFINTFVNENAVLTNDSGKFNFTLPFMNSFETGIRIVVVNGNDTVRGPWRFIFSAKNEETLTTYDSHDCNSRKTEAPAKETYIFDPETIVLP